MHRWQYVSAHVKDRAVKGAAACAVIAGLTVAALPSVARAEGGAGPAPVVAGVASAPVDVAGTAEAIVEAVDPDAVASDVLDDVMADAPDDPPAAAADTTIADAPATAAPSDGTAEMTDSSDDTTTSGADTTTDTGSKSPTAPATSDAVAVQVSPTNVNVSIRVESPGNNGPVTQVNVAASTAVGAAFEPAAKTAPAAATTEGSSPTSSTAGAAVSPTKSATIPSQTTSADTWTWDWDCLSIPTFSTISSAVSAGGPIPASWTWNWNCGGNSEQYRDVTAAQYQPVNVNVAIRISSPGNDGPVTQANIAVAVGAAITAGPGPSANGPPTADSASPSVTPLSAPETALPSLVESPTPAAPAPVAEDDGVQPLRGPTPFAATEDGLDGPLARTAPFGTLLGPVARRSGGLGTAPMPWPPGAAILGVDDASGAEGQASSASGSGRAKPAPRWRQPAQKPLDLASAPSGASVAPASGGGSSGGGLPIFLALPFVLAVLDLARRVALDRVASPSEHSDRMPDTPG